jgi:hypothetical protein
VVELFLQRKIIICLTVGCVISWSLIEKKNQKKRRVCLQIRNIFTLMNNFHDFSNLSITRLCNCNFSFLFIALELYELKWINRYIVYFMLVDFCCRPLCYFSTNLVTNRRKCNWCWPLNNVAKVNFPLCLFRYQCSALRLTIHLAVDIKGYC